MSMLNPHHNAAATQVQELEFALVTAQRSDPHVHPAIAEVLSMLNDKMGLHFVFGTEVAVGAAPNPTRELSDAGQWYLFDTTFCETTVMPFWKKPGMPVPEGCFTVPLVLNSGHVVGVIYAPRYPGSTAEQQKMLREAETSSDLIVRRIEALAGAVA